MGGCVREWENAIQASSRVFISCAADRAGEVRSSPPLPESTPRQTPSADTRRPRLRPCPSRDCPRTPLSACPPPPRLAVVGPGGDVTPLFTNQPEPVGFRLPRLQARGASAWRSSVTASALASAPRPASPRPTEPRDSRAASDPRTARVPARGPCRAGGGGRGSRRGRGGRRRGGQLPTAGAIGDCWWLG